MSKIVEHVMTADGCCRNSRGDYEGLWYPNPPRGEGWEQMDHASKQDAHGNWWALYSRTVPEAEWRRGKEEPYWDQRLKRWHWVDIDKAEFIR
jgi:hypothetical protein